MRRAFALATVLLASSGWADAAPANVLMVGNERLNRVDPALFGQFLEIASWGEPGPDALVDPRTGELPPEVVAALREVAPPVIRFPGGTDVDYLHWADRIGPRDRRGPSAGERGQKLANRFGYPEFLRLCETLDAEPLLVLNLRDVLAGDRTADDVAGLVAYCNAPGDARRAADGRAEPWGVRRWQIGNELFLYGPKLMDERGWSPDEFADAVVSSVVDIVERIRQHTPDAQIVFDGWLGHPELTERVLRAPRLRAAIDLPTFHRYRPWKLKTVTIDGVETPWSEADPDALWRLWTTMPGGFRRGEGSDGEMFARAGQAAAIGYAQVASTEWNWNGWSEDGQAHPFGARVDYLGRGLGVASFLHQLMRYGDRYVLATQSMLLSTSWNIGAVHAEPSDTKTGGWDVRVRPSGRVTGLYAQHHGAHRVASAFRDDVPVDWLDAELNHHRFAGAVPRYDAVATADDDRVVVHLLNRQREAALRLNVDVSAWPVAEKAVLHAVVSDRPMDTRIKSQAVPIRSADSAQVVTIDLPAATCAVLVIELED